MPGQYFVTVPERYKDTDDAPTDEGATREYIRTGAEQSAEVSAETKPIFRTGAEGTRRQVRKEPGDKCGTLIPVPSPVPNTPPNPPQSRGAAGTKPKSRRRRSSGEGDDPRAVPIPGELDTPEFRAAWSDFIDYRAREGEASRTDPARVAELALKKVAKVGAVVAIAASKRASANGWLAAGVRLRRGCPERGRISDAPDAAMPRTHRSSRWRTRATTPLTGFERDAAGKIITDQLCSDLACEHCKPRRTEVA